MIIVVNSDEVDEGKVFWANIRVVLGADIDSA
jgi:hypothetical protein